MCTDKNDTQIAIIENISAYDISPGKTIGRLVDVGRSRDDEDLNSDVEDEDEDVDGDESMNSEQEMDILEELFGGNLCEDDTDRFEQFPCFLK